MNNFAKIGIDNLQRIQFDNFEKDFSFIVNGKIYQTNSFVANILSPNISKNYKEKVNTSYYEINSEYEGNFNRIIEYGEMKSISFKEEEIQYFKNIMKELGNFNEFLQFSKELQEDISYENVIQRIQFKKEIDIPLDEEIKFISRNFHDFHTKCPGAIYKLDLDVIERIISNDKLKLLDEEELFDVILQLYLKSKEYSSLFSYVSFTNLSNKSIREFKEHFDINDINKSIWENICSRLEQDIPNESIETYQKARNNRYVAKREEETLQNSSEQHHNDIIQYLSGQCNGNVHTQNIVNITSSSRFSEYYDVKNIVERDDNKFFESKNEVNSWIQFDFKERKIVLDGYTIKTYSASENCLHLKSWILEVSNDGKSYTEIDKHDNSDLLNGSLRKAPFTVSHSTPQRFVRLRQTGQNWIGNNFLVINRIDFSGFLYE